MGDAIPDTRVPDTQEDFENNSQVNAAESTESQGMRNLNRKRTYDAYQDLDLVLARRSQLQFDQLSNVSLQALQNAVETTNMVAKQAIRHSDVAADALWTDELNPVTRGAGNDLTAQSPVNAALASTSSLDVAFTNVTAQNGELVSAVVSLANSQATQNAAVAAALAQLVQNMKQMMSTPAAAPAAAHTPTSAA